MNIGTRGLGPLSAGLLTMLTAACFPGPVQHSPESRYLSEELLPEMIRWNRSSSPRMVLGSRLSSKGFDYLCVVGEYRGLGEIKDSVRGVTRWKGADDPMVPENMIAIIGVKGPVGHVALVPYSAIEMYSKPKHCAHARAAVLTRETMPDVPTPVIILSNGPPLPARSSRRPEERGAGVTAPPPDQLQ